MAKRSGSRSSRSERKAGKERADRARQHGLPARQVPMRARAATPEPLRFSNEEDLSSDAQARNKAQKPGIPTLVKVLGAALVILIGAYVLSLERESALSETKPTPEVPSAAASSAPSAALAPAPVAPPSTEP